MTNYRFMNRSERRYLLLISCLFFTGSSYGFTIFDHTSMTGISLALVEVEVEVENEQAQTVELNFTAQQIARIAYANIFSDLPISGKKDDPVFHFDNELLPESNQKIVDARLEILPLLAQNDPWSNSEEVILILGETLHLVQDFYAHSTWVELGNRLIVDFTLDNSEIFRPIANDVIVCDASGRPFPGRRPSTGYYPEATLAGKCSHGPIDTLDTRYIHKDNLFRDNFGTAYALAEQETSNYVSSIVNVLERTGNVAGICALMGISEEECPVFRITNIEYTDIVNTSRDGTPAPKDIFWDGPAEFPVRAHSSFSSECRSFDCSIAALGQIFVEGNTTLFSESANPLTHLGRCFGFAASPFGGIIISADDVSVYYFLEDAEGTTTNSVLVEYNCSYRSP